MAELDRDLEDLRELVRKLCPTGEEGFEGLLAAVLTDISMTGFRLAKSGSQHGRDGQSAFNDAAITFEAKLYDDRVPKNEVLSKIAEIAVDSDSRVDLWILGSTGLVAIQDSDMARALGRRLGIGILVLDWSSTGLSGLATLLAMAPETTAKFLSEKLGDEERTIRSKLATIAKHPQFADRSQEVMTELKQPNLAPAYALHSNEAWLRKAFENTKRARAVFGQPLAPGDPLTSNALNRPAIRDVLAKCLFAVPNRAIATLLGADGNGKSWLFAQTWLAQADKTLTIVLVPYDFSGSTSREDLESLLISKLIAQTDDAPTETAKARWRKHFERWKRLKASTRPTLIVFVDGINQREGLHWVRILDALSDLLNDLGGKLTISCRTFFFRDRLEERLVSAVEKIDVPEWSQEELEGLLAARGTTTSKLTAPVAGFLRNPRIFSVASNLLNTAQIEEFEELSVSRLLFEHIRTSDAEISMPVSVHEFVRHVRDHADIIIGRLAQDRESADLTIFARPDANRLPAAPLSSQFDAVSAGRFFEPLESDPTFYRLKDDGLPLALGLSLLSSVQRACRNGADLDQELSRILDPIAALDKTSEVLLSAVLAAVLDNRSAEQVIAALIQAFISLQNPDSGRYLEFRALVRRMSSAFLLALEHAALTERLSSNLSWLTDSLFDIKSEADCFAAFTPYLHRWLNLFSDSPTRDMMRRHAGTDAEEQAKEYERKKTEIEQRLTSLSSLERKILDELVREDRGNYSHLSSITFQLLAGMSLAPFARSLRNWKFANSLNGGFLTPYQEFRTLLNFNRVDWVETRAALLKELKSLKGRDVSATGRWALASLLQATGASEDAKEAAAIIEDLTKDRDKHPRWRLIENYCATDPCDPASERPANIDETARKYVKVDFNNIRGARGLTHDDGFFEDAQIGLARFEPEVAVAGIRLLASNILLRDGPGFRLGIFLLENHTLALDDDTAKNFVAKAVAIAAQALGGEDRHKELWIAAQYALLTAFPHMTGNEQLETLVAYPKDENLLLKLGNAMRSCDPVRYEIELQRAVDSGDDSVQFKLLVFARCNGVALGQASKTLVGRLITSSSRLVRLCALGLIYHLQDVRLLGTTVASSWSASALDSAKDSYEIWYGSQVLVQAVTYGLISDEECLQRIALNAYPSFVQARGSQGAFLVAERLHVAIEKASGHQINVNLPDINQRVGQHTGPPSYHISDRPNTQETELETLRRAAETGDAWYERQERNLKAFEAFERNLTRTGADLIIESVTENLIAEIAKVDLAIVERWHQLFMDSDVKTRSQLHNIAILVAQVISSHNAAAGAALFERLENSSPYVRVTFGRAGIDLDGTAIWNTEDSDAVQTIRFKRLDQAPNDNAIAMEVLAALEAGKQDILRQYVADRASRSEPSHIARAIMVAGFSNLDNWAAEIMNRFKDSYGFLCDAYDAAKYAMDRHIWAMHWANLMANATTETDVWRYGILLSKIVDGRFRNPQCVKCEAETLLARYGGSLEELIRARIKKWQDKRSKTLFGMDAPPDVYLR
jgi:hypothetical protein